MLQTCSKHRQYGKSLVAIGLCRAYHELPERSPKCCICAHVSMLQAACVWGHEEVNIVHNGGQGCLLTLAASCQGLPALQLLNSNIMFNATPLWCHICAQLSTHSAETNLYIARQAPCTGRQCQPHSCQTAVCTYTKCHLTCKLATKQMPDLPCTQAQAPQLAYTEQA